MKISLLIDSSLAHWKADGVVNAIKQIDGQFSTSTSAGVITSWRAPAGLVPQHACARARGLHDPMMMHYFVS